MDKIIKPLLNEDGTQVIRQIKNGEWYFNNDRLLEWCNSIDESTLKYPIYYAEEWRPKEKEGYYYIRDIFGGYVNVGDTLFYSQLTSDVFRLKHGNYFQTEKEAKDINNILKVLDNMKKYYEDKLQGGGDEKL